MENNIEQIPSAEVIFLKQRLNVSEFIRNKTIAAMEEYSSLKVEEERKKHTNEMLSVTDHGTDLIKQQQSRIEELEARVKANYVAIDHLNNDLQSKRKLIEELTKALEKIGDKAIGSESAFVREEIYNVVCQALTLNH